MSLYIPSGSFSHEKTKILQGEKSKALGELQKTASAYIREQEAYPSPYLNISDYQLPRTMTEIFKWCRYFYKFDSLVGGAINALSRFPVTDIILEDMAALPKDWDMRQDSPTLRMYKSVFEDRKINELLIKIGIDYWLYGNAFIFGEFANYSDDEEFPDLRWKNLTRLDPAKMTIDVDPLTQEKTYRWDVPAKIRRIVKDRKPVDKFQAIPEIIKKAVKENKPVILNSKNIYHFSREGESGDGSVWGTPIVLNVLKQLAYRNILRQAQEAIAREHIVPFRVYYLNPGDRNDPMANWSNTAVEFARQLEEASKDPNYKVVSPLPVNVLNLGGQGRSLLLTPEIDQLQAEILAGMGVPREFIFGGISYSGSSISLRILENSFITYRLLLLDFLNNFIIRRMAEVRKEYQSEEDNIYLVSVKLADLKMQDDIQQKQLMINLNAANKVTDEYLDNMVGIDSDKMKVQLEIEMFERLERERKMKLYHLETEFLTRQAEIQYQAQLQIIQHNIMSRLAPIQPADPAQQEEGENVDEQEHTQPPPKEEEAEVQEKNASLCTSVKDITQGASSKDITQITPAKDLYLDDLAAKLLALNTSTKDEVISKLPSDIRVPLELKMLKLASAQSGINNRNIALGNMTELEKNEALKEAAKESASASNKENTKNAMKPLPELRPPRRKTLI